MLCLMFRLELRMYSEYVCEESNDVCIEDIEKRNAYFISRWNRIYDDFEDTLYPVKELKDTLKQVAQQVDLTIEMGRFFTAECGTYYTNVADLKTVGNAHYCILDGGMNHLTYLGQMMGMKTPIIKHHKNTPKQDERPEKKTWCLCGSLCTTSDILCREVELNHLEIGDTLIFENVGAYSVTEGIYLFLSRTLPRVYLKDENGYLTLVRDAMETSDINI